MARHSAANKTHASPLVRKIVAANQTLALGCMRFLHYALATRAMAQAFGAAVDRILAAPVMAAWIVRVLIVLLSVSDKSRYLIA